ncbi:MAG TPA: fasciclin domain-containing protein [Nocardioidaceae bacterium]|nr:fasciclin domain-containing protein [Nocardioidaceae bacterium]
MNLTRVTSTIAAGMLGVATLAAAPPASAAGAGERNLVDVLAADGNRLDHNWDDFDIVEKAVGRVLAAKPKSSVGVLADGSTALTAFLPTDRAFRRLVTDLTGKRRATERGVLRAVNKAVDVPTLESVLLYHVVPGATLTYRQARHADGAVLKTALAGATVRINVTKRHNVFLVDADRNDRDPRVLRAAKNLNQGNKQIAHGINRVLRPVDL